LTGIFVSWLAGKSRGALKHENNERRKGESSFSPQEKEEISTPMLIWNRNLSGDTK